MLEFSINGQIITRNDEDPIVRDSQNYVIAYFLGDEEWRSHGTVTAIFKGADGQIFNMILSYDSHYGHSCLVPWEVLTQPWFEVSAFCGNLITANTVKVFTIKSGYDSSRDSRIPTPDVYNQIIEQLNRIEDEVDPDAVKAFVDEYLEGKDFVTESDVESIVETYISEHQSQLKTSVEVTPTLTSGTKIAEIDVDGNSTELFAPEGGGGDSSENPSIALKPTVIFSFDEAYEYDSRFTILEENGFHGDFSIRASDSATSWEVWRSLIDAGHDWSIYSGNVGQTKPANNASVGAWYDYIKSGLDIAEAHGMYSPLFYSASGQMCTGNQKIAADKCGLKYIRAVIYDINNTLTPDTSWIYWSKNSFSNQFKTFIYPISINTGVSSVKTDIDNAIAGGYSICLFSHRYATDSYTEAEYREVVEYVKTKVDSGVLDCLTAREYYDKYRHEYDFQQNLIKEFPLSSLSDTTISSPQSGDVLVYDGEKWENGKVDSDNVAIHDSYKLIYDINHVTIPSTYASEMSLVDGVLTVHAPESGNHWPKYMIYDADIISQGATSCTIKINVESITQGATWRIAFIYGKTDGTQVFKYPADITRSGEYTVLWDIQYETVYNLYDGNGLTIGIVNSQTYGSDKEIVINSFNANIGNAEQPIEGDNVTEALIILDNKIEEVTTNKNNIVLTAPDGSKYAVLVDSTGSLTTSPVLPSNILYIGNSLLIGFGTHGMASTTINDDYFAKVNAYLTDAGKTLTTDKLSSGNMESATTDSAVQTWISESLAPKLSNSTELVIVCAGDNANTTEKRLEFQKGCGMVMSYIREHAPHARIAWLSTWYGSTGNNQTIQAACAKYGATYVYISDLRSNPDNHSYIGATYFDSNGNEQTVTAEGVASHPSDQGFEIIADRIIKAMFE